MAALLFGTFFLLMFIGAPIAFAIQIASAIFLEVTDLRPLILVPQRLVVGVDSFPMLAVPLFLLAGSLMEVGGISRRLVNWAETIVGGMAGGLGMVSIVSCAVFAALTGSGPATVAAIGSLLIPAMVTRNYSMQDATGLIAAAGALGPIIPPSIPMIIYGVTVSLSIPAMFIGGIIPGLFIVSMLMIAHFIVAKKKGYMGNGKPFSLKECLVATKDAFGALLLPVIILGGIYGGVVTPTEAAAVAVTYCIILSGFVYKELTIAEFKKIVIKSAEVSAMVGFIIANANLLGWIMSTTNMPAMIAEQVMKVVNSQFSYLIVLNLFLLFVGALMDTVAAIIILAPILVPIGLKLGLDPVHLGVVCVINLVIGYVTPPFGYNLFTACAITKLSLKDVVIGVLPYLFVEIVAVYIIAFIPELVTWLPNLLLQ